MDAKGADRLQRMMDSVSPETKRLREEFESTRKARLKAQHRTLMDALEDVDAEMRAYLETDEGKADSVLGARWADSLAMDLARHWEKEEE